jgi:hypothetical protein
MGSMKSLATSRVRRLEVDHVVGRSSSCALLLEHRYVSARHAIIRWTGDHWELRDLGSRNGTFLDGTRIQTGEHHRLRTGARVAFGRREMEWEIVDIAAPTIMAVPFDDGDPVVLDGELIAIPSPEEPRATIYRAADGSWALEQPMAVTPIIDQQAFTVDDRNWKFCCPDTLYRTLLTSVLSLEVRELTLTFFVSRDEEYVRVHAAGGGRNFEVGARAHHYLLLTLARRRLADSAEGVPDSSSGWVYQEDLSHDPSMVPPQLNLDVFRLRKEFAALGGVVDAANVVERRPRTRQLRVGTGRLKIVVL